MPVVDVRKVGVGVHEWSVSVRVSVGFQAVPGEIMLVLMMLIVPVRMLVIE